MAVAQRLRAVAVDDPIVVQGVSGWMLGGSLELVLALVLA